MIFSGRLDEVITIQSVTNGSDGMGATTEVWATLAGAPTMAEYIPLRGQEQIEAGKLEADNIFKLRIRRVSTVTAGCRVLVRGMTAKIKSLQSSP